MSDDKDSEEQMNLNPFAFSGTSAMRRKDE